MTSVANLNAELIHAANNGQDGSIGQILGKLAAIPISADLLRVTGIGKTVNQVQGVHRTRAQELVAQWRARVAPTLSSRESTSSVASPQQSVRPLSAQMSGS